MTTDTEPILRATGVRVIHGARTPSPTLAVDDVELEVRDRSTVGLIGESGSGKTSLGRVLALLSRPQAGTIDAFGETDLFGARGISQTMRRSIQMLHQDTGGALDPRLTVLQSVREPLDIAGELPRKSRDARARELLAQVRLGDELAHKRPGQLSGGQRQRVIIARALATNPRLLVCDEAVSALDVSVQADVLNLLQDLQRDLGLSYVFISHDLAVVLHVSDDVAVMYRGLLVEVARADAVAGRPMHPYTELLLQSIPDPSVALSGDTSHAVASDAERVAVPAAHGGCPFADRCAYVRQRCIEERPVLREVVPGRLARCHFAEELTLAGAR